MPINLNGASKDAAKKLTEAFASGEQSQVEQALAAFQASVADDVAEQYREASAANDAAVLAQRGFRQLTTKERAYFEGVAKALSSSNPKQAFTDFASVPDHMMPETVFDQVMKDIAESHPLLGALNMVNVGYVTTWLRNKHSRQLAAWGKVGEAVSKEIESAFEVIDVKQGKLSCFGAVSLDMLKLGPTWLEGYVRTVIAEAMACGLEHGVVDGSGVNGEPIGLDRDIHDGVTVSTTDGYPKKAAVAVTDLTPATYGSLVAKLAKNEQGRMKAVDFRDQGALALVVNPVDYLTKVMPATTVQATSGNYVGDLFPVPTQVFQSLELDEGEAVLALLDEYDVFVGGQRGIEYSDEFKFLDDQRVFKSVTYAYGQAYDDTSAVLLDISGLSPAYVTVQVANTVTTKASTTKASS